MVRGFTHRYSGLPSPVFVPWIYVNGNAVRGHLDLLLLAAIGTGRGHAYGLMLDLNGRTAGAIDLAQGTVYSALLRLWRAGHLARSEETVDGRRRQAYRLTDTGRQLLAAQLDLWEQLQAAVAAVLAGPESSARASTSPR